MKEIKEFTVERLEYLASHPRKAVTIAGEELAALAKIALAAKQAEPVGYFRKMPNDSYYQLSKSTAVMDEIPLYATPPLNHTEQHMVAPDGWRLVPEEATLAMLTLLGVTGSFSSMQNKYQNMLDAAPMHDDFLSNDDAKSDAWIKVSERMPDSKNDVQLFCSDTREQFVGFHRGNGMFQFFNMNDVIGECEPTHWMPLPAAPKPEM